MKASGTSQMTAAIMAARLTKKQTMSMWYYICYSPGYVICTPQKNDHNGNSSEDAYKVIHAKIKTCRLNMNQRTA